MPNLPPADTPSLLHSYFQACCCWLLQDRTALTRCGLVTPYGNIDQCQHWFRQWLVAWQHQAITWTNVDISKYSVSNFTRNANNSIHTMCSDIALLKLLPHNLGANELTCICLGLHLANMLCYMQHCVILNCVIYMLFCTVAWIVITTSFTWNSGICFDIKQASY